MTASPRPHARRRTSFAAAAGVATTFAIAFAACSQPAPLIPKGAWSLVFIDPGPECQIAGHNVSIGEVSADSRTLLVEDDNVDGSVTTSVLCSVVDDGGTFHVSANASNTAGNVLTLIVDIAAGATKDSPSKGTISYMSPNTATTFTSQECNFYFLDGTGQGAKAGQVWMTFDCPTITEDIDNVCQIQIAYAAFEQCDSTGD